MKRFLILYVNFLFIAGEGGSCPESFPYVYLNGNYCCKSGFEKNNPIKDGELCDGSKIGVTSKCCEGNKYQGCPKKPCKNYQGKHHFFNEL